MGRTPTRHRTAPHRSVPPLRPRLHELSPATRRCPPPSLSVAAPPPHLSSPPAAAGMRVTLLEQRHHLGGAVGAHGRRHAPRLRRRILRNPQPIVSDLVVNSAWRPDRHPNSLRLLAVPAARRPPHPSTGIMGDPGNVNDKSLIPVIGKKGLRRAQVDKFHPSPQVKTRRPSVSPVASAWARRSSITWSPP